MRKPAARGHAPPPLRKTDSPRTRRRQRMLGVIGSLLLLGSLTFGLSSCEVVDEYWDKDPDLLLGPPPDLTPPEVRLIAPAGPDSANASPVGGREVAIEIQASDDHELSVVELYIDDGLELSLATPPFRFEWNTTELEEASIHAIWALATDTSDNTAWSDTLYAVVFNEGPQVVMRYPENGAFISGDVPLEVEPLDPRTPISRVDFLIDGLPIGSDSSSPFTIEWDSTVLPPGDHFLSAMAWGDNNALGIAPFVPVVLNNHPPRVRLTFPETRRTVARRGTVPFSASAIDTVHGAIGDSLVWTSDLDGPLGRGEYLRVTDLSPGVHRISVEAFNAWGLRATSEIDLIVNETPSYSYCFEIFLSFLLNKCYVCHNPGAPEIGDSEFDMTSLATIAQGGRSLRELGIEALVPCKPDSSLFYVKIVDETPVVGTPMPPPGESVPLLPEEIEKLRIWIEEGAPPDEGATDEGC